MELDSTLLGVLACPNCHANLSVDYEAAELVCNKMTCGLAFPIRNNIPIMLIDEARNTRVILN
ncbi:MAG: Trm112 family protein [Propionibacteriaceae bacterium]|nr:Trm112 family protein [Propionibacteriaceae bacterium]